MSFSISFEGLLEQVLTGDLLGAMSGFMQAVIDGLGEQVVGVKNILAFLAQLIQLSRQKRTLLGSNYDQIAVFRL